MRKIAIVGPESTGKSALSKLLADHFGCRWVPEVARNYLEKLGRPYTRSDVEEIARLQLQEEEKESGKTGEFLICDTNLLVIKIWMEHAYGFCPEWIENEIRARKYDLHILMKPDIGWVPDPLREHPDLQLYFFSQYEKALVSLECAWISVGGHGPDRLKNALQGIHEILGP
jgi:nicotinamide riboside kinase